MLEYVAKQASSGDWYILDQIANIRITQFCETEQEAWSMFEVNEKKALNKLTKNRVQKFSYGI